MPSKHERRFLEKLLEKSHDVAVSKAQALEQWKLLSDSEGFDLWAAKKFPNVKRCEFIIFIRHVVVVFLYDEKKILRFPCSYFSFTNFTPVLE